MHQLKIRTIKEFCESKYKEKGSLFIAQAYPLVDIEEIAGLLKSVKKKFYNAAHHCYAYRLNENVKYSDDGEPSGSAGIRILNALDHFKLNHVLIVVIRYFGGTKLGIGPLGKAYYNSAAQTLQACSIIEKFGYNHCKITVDFSFMSGVYRILNDFEAKIISCDYKDKTDFSVLIKPHKIDKLRQEVENLTSGNFSFSFDHEVTYL